jgi:hypothetical protein
MGFNLTFLYLYRPNFVCIRIDRKILLGEFACG